MVSYVIAVPQLVTAAATDLAGIGSVIGGQRRGGRSDNGVGGGGC
ncbi:hypothetical protein LAUMK4_00590 [Mycobacterium persicum]|uniref:PE family protein n=1 Tax=Mycobacterium persicum TaxID=1487726 RepID=A0AB38UMY5_9MYCO|nr:hypothetical protein LAUMK15_00943 [Mycobacterium persicum]VAZ82013.1 hypothetical protein LAUMK42_00816 [Mycobacterium persicum]VAZ88111.1 hypothetical protein LAUMK4_00590 [Mycobacterium persicum]